MLKLANRVKETTVSEGTGSVILGGGFGAFQTFSSAIGNANETFYTIENEIRWEVGIGTYTSSSNSLSRDTVLSSSNAGSKIDLSGLSIVFCTLPAEKTVFFGDNNYLPEGKPLTLTRESAGNFIHAFVDNDSDETVALHMENSSNPTWRFGLKNTPNSKTSKPSYGYVHGANGTAGLYGDSDAYAYMDVNLGFYIVHETANLVQVTKDGGTQIKNGSAAVNALTVKGASAQSYPLQVWTNFAGTTLSSVGPSGSLALGKATAPNYTLDVNGTANLTTLRFADGSSQTTASKPSGEFVALSGVVETNKTNIAANTAQTVINKATTVGVSGLLTGVLTATSGALINSSFMPLVSGQVINTMLAAHDYLPVASGAVINTMLAAHEQGGSSALPASSGTAINSHFMPLVSGDNFMPILSGVSINTFFATKQDTITASNRIDSAHIAGGNVSNTEFGFLNGVSDDIQTQLDAKIPTSSGYLPISSGAVINDAFVDIISGLAVAGGLPAESGTVINTALTNVLAGSLPVSSGAKIISDYMNVKTSGDAINTALTNVLAGSLPVSSGAAVNAHFMPMVSGDAKYIPVSSGAAINAHFMPLVSGAAVLPASSGALINTMLAAHSQGMPSSSGAVINTALTNVLAGSLPVSSGAKIISDYMNVKTSGDVINTALTNVLAGSLPVSSGAAVNAHFMPMVSGDAKYLPVASGAIINDALIDILGGSIPKDSGYLPIASGAVINTMLAAHSQGGGSSLPATSGALINTHFLPKASGNAIYLPTASGATINAHFMPMVSGDAKFLPVASGGAVLPASSGALINTMLAAHSFLPLASGSAINAHFAPLVSGDAKFLPIGSGALINTHFLPKASGNAIYLPTSSGANISANFMPLHSGIAINADYMPAVSGAAINAHFGPLVSGDAKFLPIGSGATINAHFMPMVSGDVKFLPVASGAVINTMLAAHEQGGSSSLPATSGAKIISDYMNVKTSGDAIASHFMPLHSGIAINADYMPTVSGAAINAHFMPMVSGDAKYVPVASGAAINDHFMPLVSGQAINADYMLAASGAVINAHFAPLASGDAKFLPVSSGAAIASHFMPLHSGIAINADYMPAVSGAAINAHFGPLVSGDAKFLPIGSGALMNTHFLPKASGNAIYLPTASGAVINTMLAAHSQGGGGSVDIDGLDALGGVGVHQTQDHFIFSDNGTEKKITFSNLQDAIFADISGDGAVAAGGALTIADDKIGSAELVDACSAVTSFTAPLIEGTTSIQTPLIEYTDGDDAITIADGGAVTFAQSINQAHEAVSLSSNTATFNCALSNYFEVAVNAQVNSILFTNATAGQRIVILATESGGAANMSEANGWDTITINTNSGGDVEWAGGTEPTLGANTKDMYGIIFSSNVLNAYGFIIGQDLKD